MRLSKGDSSIVLGSNVPDSIWSSSSRSSAWPNQSPLSPSAPAGFVLLGVLLEVRGADRTIGREALEDELAEPSSRRQPGRRRASVGPGRRQREVKRAVVGGDDGRLMGPVLIEAALVPQKGVDQLWIVRTEAAEKDEQMAAGDNGGRV